MARGRHPARIKIKPPDTETSARYLLRWYGRELHFDPGRFPGLTSPELFQNNNPLEIDFGCGTGSLVCERAAILPNVNLIGIDNSQKPLFCAIITALAGKLENIRFIYGNFTAMLPLLREHSVSTAYYLLPNPPRDYHVQRANLHRRQFLQSVYTSLVPEGKFYFATDSEAFFICVKGILDDELRYPVIDLEPEGAIFPTHYWRIWEQRGKKVYCLAVEKK